MHDRKGGKSVLSVPVCLVGFVLSLQCFHLTIFPFRRKRTDGKETAENEVKKRCGEQVSRWLGVYSCMQLYYKKNTFRTGVKKVF